MQDGLPKLAMRATELLVQKLDGMFFGFGDGVALHMLHQLDVRGARNF